MLPVVVVVLPVTEEEKKNEEEEEVHALRTLTDKIAQVCDLITKSKSKDGVRA